MKELEQLIRKNILRFTSYTCEWNKHTEGNGKIMLNNNENPYNKPFNRYPDPLQIELKKRISPIKRVYPDCIFIGNDSGETIDLIYRCFTEPRIDNVVAIEPTFNMYRVCADINDVEYRMVELDEDFQISADKILSATDEHTKIIWICSPNTPTGNDLNKNEIIRIITEFDGIVIVDEMYSDFSCQQPFRLELHKYPNLIVLDTFSKAWGCAALCVGMAYAQPAIIDIFSKVKYPYNINSLTQEMINKQLDKRYEVDKWISIMLMERERMLESFSLLPTCIKVYPTSANFFLAHMKDAGLVYQYLIKNDIIVKNVSNINLCNNCLRITVGSKSENGEILSLLRQLK